MTGGMTSVTDREKAKRRLEFMERAAMSRGIQATKTEPMPDGSVNHFVDDVSPYLELYWALEIGGDEKAAAELCLWFMDNPDHEHSFCFYLRYSAGSNAWEFGYDRDDETIHESPKAKRLAEEAFGFKRPGSRDVDEPSALTIINALCAGFAATIPKKDKDL